MQPNRKIHINVIIIVRLVLESEESSEKSDVYSFGLILWEFVTKKKPFTHYKTEEKLKRAVCKGKRPTIPSNCPKLLA